MTVTLLYTSLLALWFVILSARVIGYRGTASISLGDGDDAAQPRPDVPLPAHVLQVQDVVVHLLGGQVLVGTPAVDECAHRLLQGKDLELHGPPSSLKTRIECTRSR